MRSSSIESLSHRSSRFLFVPVTICSNGNAALRAAKSAGLTVRLLELCVDAETAGARQRSRDGAPGKPDEWASKRGKWAGRQELASVAPDELDALLSGNHDYAH